MVGEKLDEMVRLANCVRGEKVNVFVSVPQWVVSVEIATPEHMLVLSLPEIVRIVT
jgi:hypothetical protein